MEGVQKSPSLLSKVKSADCPCAVNARQKNKNDNKILFISYGYLISNGRKVPAILSKNVASLVRIKYMPAVLN